MLQIPLPEVDPPAVHEIVAADGENVGAQLLEVEHVAPKAAKVQVIAPFVMEKPCRAAQ